MGKGSNKVLYREALAQGQKPIYVYNVFDRKGFPFIEI